MARRIVDDEGNVTGFDLDESDMALIKAVMTEPTIRKASEKAGLNYEWAREKFRQLCSFGILKRVMAVEGREFYVAMRSAEDNG